VFLHSCVGGKREMEASASKNQLRRASFLLTYADLPPICMEKLFLIFRKLWLR
jgi:hypothetical protein